MNLSRTFSQAGRSGLEFAAGIPGSLGGAIKMNAGAHGESISQVIAGVVVVEPNGNLRTISNAELNFSYRQSAVSNNQVILAACITSKEGDIEQIRSKREE